jgi:hypothetical protein
MAPHARIEARSDVRPGRPHTTRRTALGDVFRAAFADLAQMEKERQRTRAREFALLGPGVIALLLPKLSATEEPTRERAVVILRAITGHRMGYDASAPESEREPRAQHWTLWYMTNRGTLARDPARSRTTDQRPRPPPGPRPCPPPVGAVNCSSNEAS